MGLSKLPLCYCTNVHPGLTAAAVIHGLKTHTQPVAAKYGRPLAAGLWLAKPVVTELLTETDAFDRFAAELQSMRLSCHTLNAFPYGNFHDVRVKDAVYRPAWNDHARFQYTIDCARVLSRLLPDGGEGTISTVPLGFKQHATTESWGPADCMNELLQLAQALHELWLETGRCVRLAIEPEPYCLLETTPETITFFEQLWFAAEARGMRSVVREHIGVCLDVCHQSVEFEDLADSLNAIRGSGIRINKLHLTCAVELRNPRQNFAGREFLASFAEPKYLHQTFARFSDGGIASLVDLTPEFALRGDVGSSTVTYRNAQQRTDSQVDSSTLNLLDADTWRVHFHVPVHLPAIGPLHTTRVDLVRAIDTVAAWTEEPQLEVETYTWPVLPGENSLRPPSLNDGLLAELNSVTALLDARKPAPGV